MLSESQCLDLWDRLETSPRFRWPLVLLAATDIKRESPAATLSIGAAHARLIRLRMETFGAYATGTALCTRCGQRQEITVSLAELLPPTPPEVSPIIELDHTLQARLPTYHDVAEVGQARGDETDLLQRCVVPLQTARRTEVDLNDQTVATMETAMEQNDPLADIRLDVCCADCKAVNEIRFDIVTFLASDLEQLAVRFSAVVHTLARAYGWSERAILNLSPQRRQRYLKMVNA